MAHKLFQCLHLYRKLTTDKLCKNTTFAKFLETAYGFIISTKLQAGIDQRLFGDSNKFVSPVSTRVVQSKKALAFMMPNSFNSLKYIYFSCPCAFAC